MSNTTEFMGTTVLNITTTGESLAPDAQDVIELLWPDDGLPFDVEPTTTDGDQVVVQVEYGYSKSEELSLTRQGASKLTSYFVIFLCLVILILLVLMISICFYNRFARADPDVKIAD